jgi:hypothetical protein
MLNFLVGNCSASGYIRLASLYGLYDVEVVQDIFDATVIGQPIEERSDRLFCFHEILP